MQFEKFTLKSQEAVQTAQQIATQHGHQEMTTAHLAKAILEQPEGVVVPTLQKMGVEPSRVLSTINQLISDIPKVSGSGAGQVYISTELQKSTGCCLFHRKSDAGRICQPGAYLSCSVKRAVNLVCLQNFGNLASTTSLFCKH